MFLQPDPIGYSDGMNLYAYVGNDPLNFTDLTGQFKGDLRGEYYDLVSDELSEDDLRAEMEQMMGNFLPDGVVTTRTAFAFRSFARQLFDKAKVSRFINSVANSALNQFGRSIDDQSGAASQPFKNTGLTKAARALDRHAAGQRSSGTFPRLSGNATAKNKQAQQVVDDILGNSKSEFKILGRVGLEVRSPSGQEIRFVKNGSFSSFVD